MNALEFTVPNPRTATGITIIGAAKSAMQGRPPFDCPVRILIEWRLNETKTNPHLPFCIYTKVAEICAELAGKRFVFCETWQPYELHVFKTSAFDELETLTVRIEEL
jgi:hypothetical protein